MNVVYWVAAGLIALVLFPAALFYVTYLVTSEAYPKKMARRFFGWAIVILLTTFNIAILNHIMRVVVGWF